MAVTERTETLDRRRQRRRSSRNRPPLDPPPTNSKEEEHRASTTSQELMLYQPDSEAVPSRQQQEHDPRRSSRRPQDQTAPPQQSDSGDCSTKDEEGKPSIRIPRIVSVTIQKQHPHEPVGLNLKALKSKRSLPTGLELSSRNSTTPISSSHHNSSSNSKDSSVVVSSISPQSPFLQSHTSNPHAQTAIQPGDEVLTINNHRIKTPQRAAEMIRSFPQDVDLTLVFSRGERMRGTAYTMVKLPSQSSHHGNAAVKNDLGIEFEVTNKILVRIKSISRSGLFSTSGLKVGDAVLSIEGSAVRTAGEATRALVMATCSDQQQSNSNRRGQQLSNRATGSSKVVALLTYSLWGMRSQIIQEELIDGSSENWQVLWSYDQSNEDQSADRERGEINAREWATLRIAHTTVDFRLVFDEDGTCSCPEPFAALTKIPQEHFTNQNNDNLSDEESCNDSRSILSRSEARAALDLLYGKFIQTVIDAINYRTWKQVRLLAQALSANVDGETPKFLPLTASTNARTAGANVVNTSTVSPKDLEKQLLSLSFNDPNETKKKPQARKVGKEKERARRKQQINPASSSLDKSVEEKAKYESSQKPRRRGRELDKSLHNSPITMDSSPQSVTSPLLLTSREQEMLAKNNGLTDISGREQSRTVRRRASFYPEKSSLYSTSESSDDHSSKGTSSTDESSDSDSSESDDSSDSSSDEERQPPHHNSRRHPPQQQRRRQRPSSKPLSSSQELVVYNIHPSSDDVREKPNHQQQRRHLRKTPATQQQQKRQPQALVVYNPPSSSDDVREKPNHQQHRHSRKTPATQQQKRQRDKDTTAPTNSSLHLNIRKGSVREMYKVYPKVIGDGAFGVVRSCYNRQTKDRFAVKSILKKSHVKNATLLKNEISLLQKVKHRNVVRVVDVIEDGEYIHIVMEECKGGDLFDKVIEEKVRLDEGRVSEIIGSLLDAVAYLHKLNIVHRDLKAEHLMLSRDDINSSIKIIDFGLAITHNPEAGDPPLTAFAGSPFTIAPEVVKRRYGKECDLWSVGVVAYFLLTRIMPFNAKSDDEIFKKVNSGHFTYPNWAQTGISHEAKDFISRLIVVDPKARSTAKQALTHPWIVKHFRQHDVEQMEEKRRKAYEP